MKDKTRKATTSKDTGRKVFDVMKPGNSMVSATSRPVIVGHKPQVKDPMMAERADDENKLMDSKQKVVVAPGSSPAAESASTTTQPDTPVPSAAVETIATATGAASAPDVPQSIASVAMPDTVERAADASLASTAQPPLEATLSTDTETTPASKTLAPSEPNNESSSTQPLVAPEGGGTTVGVVYEELPTTTEQPKTPASAEPLPVLPDEPVKQQVIVSHHGTKAGFGKTVAIILVILVVCVLVFNVLLDAGFVGIEGVPHTNFF